MLAWNNSAAVKEAALERLREHRRLDQLRPGTYWVAPRGLKSGHGCYLGCLTQQPGAVEAYEDMQVQFGIPGGVTNILERVFEDFSPAHCCWWAIESAKAIPVGADLVKIIRKLEDAERDIWVLNRLHGSDPMAWPQPKQQELF